MLVGFGVLGEGKMWGGGRDGVSLAYPKLRRAGAVQTLLGLWQGRTSRRADLPFE